MPPPGDANRPPGANRQAAEGSFEKISGFSYTRTTLPWQVRHRSPALERALDAYNRLPLDDRHLAQRLAVLAEIARLRTPCRVPRP